MNTAPIFKKAYWSLAVLGGLYFLYISLLLNGWIQRQAIYAHKLKSFWWADPKKPEQSGFLVNQVRPFHIHTPDEEVLFAWHILPLALYAQHEEVLVNEPVGFSENIQKTEAFKLLETDRESRLVINFHGNAGTVSQGWRTDTYRAVYSGASDKIHVLTVDYRGFGYSSGSPTEEGVITDGLTLLTWALDVAHIPPERIVLLGQSLGTAVTTAVAERILFERQIELAGVVLVAGFSDIPTLMLSYSIGGIFPVLSPLKPYPVLQNFFANRIQETWQTGHRLANLVRYSKNIDLTLIHSRNDFDIPWKHCDALFYLAANATSEQGMTLKQMDQAKTHIDLGNAGWINTWTAAGRDNIGTRRIRQEIVSHGGHNRVVTYPAVAKAVLKSLKLHDRS